MQETAKHVDIECPSYLDGCPSKTVELCFSMNFSYSNHIRQIVYTIDLTYKTNDKLKKL